MTPSAPQLPVARKRLVVVSGLAGAGKTVALRALEDLGYYCVDNLPSALYPAFLAALANGELASENAALALDSRDEKVPEMLSRAQIQSQAVVQFELIFLEADVAHLMRRFRETRRSHPLSQPTSHGTMSLADALKRDQELLRPLRVLATRVLDTSEMPAPALRQIIRQMYSPSAESEELLVSIVSFGFKHGAPQDLDTVFDVRCFDNPHYVDELRPLAGLSPRIQEFVFGDPEVTPFVGRVAELLESLYPLYRKEGKRYFAVGFGCTGGRHRSVAIAENIASRLRQKFPFVRTEHRHLDRDSS